MRHPAISVLLPVFNGEKFLRQSIESVLAQDFVDFELIIWDDGSRDSSMAIAQEYQDERVIIRRNDQNRGLFVTLNLAICASRGRLLKLWAQDDVMKRTCLSIHYRFHELHPSLGMTYTARNRIGADGRVHEYDGSDRTPDVIPPALAAAIMFFHGSIAGNIANVMLAAEVLEAVGMFRDDMRYAGDFEMWVRISAKHNIGFINEPLIDLRSHKDQFSANPSEYVTCMGESIEVYETLFNRLTDCDARYLRRYQRWNLHRQYVHHMITRLMARDAVTARDAFRIVRRVDNVWLLLAIWLLTANGRFLKMAPAI